MLPKSHAHRHHRMITKKRTTSVPPVKNTVSVSLYPPKGKVGEPLELTCLSTDAVASAIRWYLGNDTKGIQRSATDCSPSGSPPFYNLELYNFTCDKNHNRYSMTILRLQTSDRDQCWSCSYAYNNFTATNISLPACIIMESLTEVLARNTVSVPMSPMIKTIGFPMLSMKMIYEQRRYMRSSLELTCTLYPESGEKPSDITWYRGNETKGIKRSTTDCSLSGSSSLYDLNRYDFTCDLNRNRYTMTTSRLLDSDNGTCWSCGVAYNDLPAPNKSARDCIMMTEVGNTAAALPLPLSSLSMIPIAIGGFGISYL